MYMSVSVSIATSISIPSFLILQVILKYINLPTAHNTNFFYNIHIESHLQPKAAKLAKDVSQLPSWPKM